jgi:transcriptional regulator with PAS, ATPase and Fis domain
MESEDRKKALERQVLDLVKSANAIGGIDFLREMESLFSGEASKIRKGVREGSFAPEIRPDEIHRERYAEIIGNAPSMLRVFGLLDKVAPSSVPVLIQGESGTGKELVARAIHMNSPRRDKEYVTENCAAIPETLLESELFGYKRGAFTGAERNKRGLFVVADGGTLFLDEIGDMSLNMQKKLLRVLQDGEIRPVGGNEVIHVDVRILSASNRNLREMVSQGFFREDLYYRLNTITLELPPLRERKVDISELVAFLIDKVSEEMNVNPLPVSEKGMEALMRYQWPGNIRELENEIRRCLALKSGGEEIDLEDLSDEVKNG